MKRTISIQQRRIWILINFSSLIFLIIVYEFLTNSSVLEIWLGIVLLALFLLILVISFRAVYGSTGLWKHIHKKSDKLDEREALVLTNAIRLSYTIFIIVVIAIIYAFAVIEKGPIDAVIAAGLIYFAQILPAAVIGWNQKEI